MSEWVRSREWYGCFCPADGPDRLFSVTRRVYLLMKLSISGGRECFLPCLLPPVYTKDFSWNQDNDEVLRGLGVCISVRVCLCSVKCRQRSTLQTETKTEELQMWRHNTLKWIGVWIGAMPQPFVAEGLGEQNWPCFLGESGGIVSLPYQSQQHQPISHAEGSR